MHAELASPGSTKRLLVVNDHPVVSSAFEAMFSNDREFEVVSARGAEQAQLRFAERRPTVTVIDVSMAGMSGFELTRLILETNAAANILLFGMSNDPIYAARSLESGAKGYVCKSGDTEQISHAVRCVAAGGTFIAS